MPKFLQDSTLDLQLDVLETTNIHVCSGQPTTYAEIAGLELATQVISGSFTKAAGDVSGRKTTVPAQSAVTIDTSGTATHVVLSNGTTTMTAVTTCTSQALTAGGTVDIPAFDLEIGDPT